MFLGKKDLPLLPCLASLVLNFRFYLRKEKKGCTSSSACESGPTFLVPHIQKREVMGAIWIAMIEVFF